MFYIDQIIGGADNLQLIINNNFNYFFVNIVLICLICGFKY